MKKIFSLLFLLVTCIAQAQNVYRTDKDISYVSGSETDTYRQERCKLDIYYPENKKDFSTIVWFHGGGMEGGNKFILKELREQGFAVVAVNYRLSPKVRIRLTSKMRLKLWHGFSRILRSMAVVRITFSFPVILREVIFH